jgi:hypothetical protein
MKKSTLRKLSSLILLVGAMSFGYIHTANAAGMCATVTFGTVQDHGMPCIGKGVCKASTCSFTSASSVTNGIMVYFEVSPTDPNILIMSFHLSDLMNSQPEQAEYFTDNTAGYPFDVSFVFSDAMWAPLNLPAGTYIPAATSSTVVINGNIVSNYITIAHP